MVKVLEHMAILVWTSGSRVRIPCTAEVLICLIHIFYFLPLEPPPICVECMLIIIYEDQKHRFAILIFQEKKEKKERKTNKNKQKKQTKKTNKKNGVWGQSPRFIQQQHQLNSTLTLSIGTMPLHYRP